MSSQKALTSSGDDLRARILDVLPAATFALDRLLRMCDVVPSSEVATAAIECVAQPRLLVNPEFVRSFCVRDEHLFLLVMHELHHLLLGHTRLFRRPTQAHNLAFDAVINSMLCRQFPAPEYVSFFRSINDWNEFPGRLLRPPPGWPSAPEPLPPDASEKERILHARLYGDDAPNVTYGELFELLVELMDERRTPDHHVPTLLGRHDEPADGETPETCDPVVRDLVRSIIERWPPPPRPLGGRDQGRAPDPWRLPGSDRDPDRKLREAVALLLSGATRHAGAAGPLRFVGEPVATAIDTVVPQLRDRRAPAFRRLLGAPPLLWRGEVDVVRPRLRHVPAHVYLDVSGSVWPILARVAPVLLHFARRGAARLFAFSTVVDEIVVPPGGDWSAVSMRNTGGTDFTCVIAHLESLPPRHRPRHVVAITDGYVGPVDSTRFARLAVELAVGLVPPIGTVDLASVAARLVTLPISS
ncbi:MAG: hypothetical protein EXS13_12070 [Planctomycetes bacterium]|nr:hypothetical protein [Planctomycetota bacterium]